jgi:pilus assembly protein CpaC
MIAVKVGASLAMLLGAFIIVFATLLPAEAGGRVGNSAYIQISKPGIVQRLRLTISKSETIRLSDAFSEAMVANPQIADVVPLTDQSVYIVGKEVGLTRLTLLGPDKKLIAIIEIEVSYDIAGLAAELRRSVPGGSFELRTANGRIIIAGMVPDAIALSQANSIAQQFTASCASAQLRELTDAAQGNWVDAPKSSNRSSANNTGRSGGGGREQQSSEQLSAKCFVNMLTVRAPQQVLLEVRFVEAQRSAARNLGLAWDSRASRFRGIAGGTTTSPTISPTVDPNTKNDFGGVKQLSPGVLNGGSLLETVGGIAAPPFGTFVASILSKGFSADVVVQALEERGIARRLAEPNLVTLSGDTANFLAGGEFPFPVAAEDNKITIEFKKFGVGLAFTPTVLADSQINLKIEPEVSDLDPSNSILVANTLIPSLVVRRASTTVELRDGQSFAIAGLLHSKHTKSTRELPWIAQVPVLGTLFRSAAYEKNDSDLVIIVTPRLVRPARPGEPLKTPLDQRLSGNDRDYFLGGRLEVPKNFEGPYGHILDLAAAEPVASKEERIANGPKK